MLVNCGLEKAAFGRYPAEFSGEQRKRVVIITRALIASFPVSIPGQIKEKWKMINSIPSMVNIPSGCRFHTRCPYATEKCKREEPGLKKTGKNHWVACHYPVS